MTCDVIVSGAGPAGVLTALILARAGARVQLVDRARFPRDKLCGDTLNPGAMRTLAEHVSTSPIIDRALALDGMVLTGPSVAIHGRYPAAAVALSIPRRDLDSLLLDQAVSAGAQFEDHVTTVAPVTGSHGAIEGIVLRRRNGRRHEIKAALVIAADGHTSRLARAAHLTRARHWPRRWAIGGHFAGVRDLTTHGEMHVRAGHYIGVAPLPGGIANACLVLPFERGRAGWRDPAGLLTDHLRSDVRLGDRFAQARLVTRPQVLGPMAVDAPTPGAPGLLLAGDAAGFIDPITGDGLRFALAGGALAAGVALDVLRGHLDPHRAVATLASKRRAAFAHKWRFNRAIRRIVSRPVAITAAGVAARIAPAAFEAMIRYAGDCE